MFEDKMLKIVHAKMDREYEPKLEIIGTGYVEISNELKKFYFVFDGFTFECELFEDNIIVRGDFIWIPRFEFSLTEKYNTTHMFSVNGFDAFEISLENKTD